MEIILLKKGMDKCLENAKSLFIDSAFRFRPVLKGIAQIAKSEIEREVNKAIANPDNHAIFVGVEERDSEKSVVAVSHVMFGGDIPTGWILIRWIGTKKPAKDGIVYGSEMMAHILNHYKEEGYQGAYTEFPAENLQVTGFFKKHNFKESGMIRLERKL